ncbi:glycosyltransferase family 2 protein [bacterium]|nr:glycosyltransferase family 2 protein [bacterium]
MYKNLTISAVVPCYNEELGIAKVIKSFPDFIDEIIVVDNNSTDKTSEIAESLGARIIFEKKQGYGRAYKTGFKAVENDIVITMDGDASYPASPIQPMLDRLVDENLDFISAARMPVDWDRNKENVKRFVGNKILSLMIMILFTQNIEDSQSGMWVFRRKILDIVKVRSDGMSFSEELKIEAFSHPEIKSIEIPFQFKYQHREGQSKLNLWKDGFKNLIFLFQKKIFG